MMPFFNQGFQNYQQVHQPIAATGTVSARRKRKKNKRGKPGDVPQQLMPAVQPLLQPQMIHMQQKMQPQLVQTNAMNTKGAGDATAPTSGTSVPVVTQQSGTLVGVKVEAKKEHQVLELWSGFSYHKNLSGAALLLSL